MSIGSMLPNTVAFEIASVCVLSCSYCDKRNWSRYGIEREKKYMEFRLFKKVIDEMAQLNTIPSITLSYEGESLIHPDFCNFLEYLNEKNIRPWVTTSLLGGNLKKLDAMIDYCDTISVSLDGDEHMFVKNRGSVKQFKQVREQLNRLLRRKKRSCVKINLNMTLPPPHNISSNAVKHFIDRWIHEVDELYIWKQIQFGEKIIYLHRDGIEKHLKRRRPCQQPFNYAAILTDGRIAPCCNTSRTVLPGLNIANGYVETFTSQIFKTFLNNHKKCALKGTPCENCELWLDDWLGDEVETIVNKKGEAVTCYHEGNTIRIPSYTNA